MNLMTILTAIVLHFAAPLAPAGVTTPTVTCSPTLAQYFVSANVSPIVPWPGGVTGAYYFPTNSIYLSPQECANLTSVIEGKPWTWQRGYSVLVLTHEITHGIGLKTTKTSPAPEGYTNTIGHDYDEADADCGAVEKVDEALKLMGRKDAAIYTGIKSNLEYRAWGYNNVPAPCWSIIDNGVSS